MINLKNGMKLLAVLSLGVAPAFAQESAGEKANATGNDVKRGAKKAVNRVDEAGCTGTKAECDAAKVQHRGTETKDKVVDKTKETKDKLDADGKPTK